MFSLLNTC